MLISTIVNGISSSFILLLCSLGLVIIMGYMKVVNLAHTEVLMLGAYVCYGIYTVLELPFILAVICAYIMTLLFQDWWHILDVVCTPTKKNENMLK